MSQMALFWGVFDDQLCDTDDNLIEDVAAHQLRTLSKNRGWPLPKVITRRIDESPKAFKTRQQSLQKTTVQKQARRRLFRMRQMIDRAPLQIREAGADGLAHAVYWKPTWQDPSADPAPEAFRAHARQWRLDIDPPDWCEAPIPC